MSRNKTSTPAHAYPQANGSDFPRRCVERATKKERFPATRIIGRMSPKKEKTFRVVAHGSIASRCRPSLCNSRKGCQLPLDTKRVSLSHVHRNQCNSFDFGFALWTPSAKKCSPDETAFCRHARIDSNMVASKADGSLTVLVNGPVQ